MSDFVVSQRYVFLVSPSSGNAPASGGTLLDEQTGRRTRVDRPGCRPGLLGGPWLLFDCYPQTPRLELYRIPSRAWLAVQPTVIGAPWFIGARWIQFHSSFPPWGWVFHNIQTGQERTLAAWHPGGTAIPDLDSSSLGRKLCRPLHVPDAWNNTAETEMPGAVSFLGGFAVAQGTTRVNSQGRFTAFTNLERCGTRLRKHLSDLGPYGDLQGNARAIVWQPRYAQDEQGIFLPSMRRFVVRTEGLVQLHTFQETYKLWLTQRTMYLLAPWPPPDCGHGTCTPAPSLLWAAPSPAPPRNTR